MPGQCRWPARGAAGGHAGAVLSPKIRRGIDLAEIAGRAGWFGCNATDSRLPLVCNGALAGLPAARYPSRCSRRLRNCIIVRDGMCSRMQTRQDLQQLGVFARLRQAYVACISRWGGGIYKASTTRSSRSGVNVILLKQRAAGAFAPAAVQFQKMHFVRAAWPAYARHIMQRMPPMPGRRKSALRFCSSDSAP